MPPKNVLRRMRQLIETWDRMRPGKCFAGYSLDQFRTLVLPALEARRDLSQIENRRCAMRARRRVADALVAQAMKRIVLAVQADADEGDDGEFYAALGFVPQSERVARCLRSRNVTKPAEAQQGTRKVCSDGRALPVRSTRR